MKFYSSEKIPEKTILILPSWNSINQINTCLDLLIFNSDFKKIGTLESLYTLPIVGSDAFGGDKLSTALEVYKKDNYILLQARSNIYKVRV